MTLLKRLTSPLSLLVIAYLLAGTIYSVATPILEASDELWHYPMVKYLANHGLQLPVQNPTVTTEFRQEGSQPPLYYMLSAILTGWIDTSDIDVVRRINPHADIGIVTADGNFNMLVHDPAVEAFPWHGTVLAIHLSRLLSVLLGALSVAATYLIAEALFPARRWLPLVAGIFTAFNPMFLFISGSVNNDNLSNALAAVLLLFIVRLVKRRDEPPTRDLILIGIVSGAGMLAKFNNGFLTLLVAVALAVIAYRLRRWRPLLVGALVTGGLTIAIAGWWYVRNWQLYGDPTGLNMMLRIVGERTVPANLAQLWSERFAFEMSYWGFFGGVNLPISDLAYTAFNLIAVVALVGLVVWAIRKAGLLRRFSPGPFTGESLAVTDRTFDWSLVIARALTILWIGVLFVSLLRWTASTWATQGRLMFSAIAPISAWMAAGLFALPTVTLRRIVVTLAVGWYAFAGAILAPWHIIQSYALCEDELDPRPSCVSLQQPTDMWQDYPATFHEPDHDSPVISFDPSVQFTAVGHTKPGGDLHPGDTLQFMMPFHVDARTSHFSRDWSIFIHLENAAGLIVWQRDVYPGQGKYATSLMNGEMLWYNRFAVSIPDQAYVPQSLRVYLGMYDLHSGARMIAQGSGANTDNRIYLGTIRLTPRVDNSLPGIPNPMHVNFGGEAELLGYDVSRLAVYPGQPITVTLYWRPIHPLTTDYHVFTQILMPGTSNVV
ncbi:MAG TPA: glycosyltransferase family 39 protein, partial [Aggregatilineales bacterium]|nr:glycosyltransferase family 39 protein [Aggregatilineales bacterium]